MKRKPIKPTTTANPSDPIETVYQSFVKIRSANLAAKTQVKALWILNTLWDRCGKMTLAELNLETIAEWVDWSLHDNEESPNTVKMRIQCLRGFLSWCRDMALLEGDPTRGLPRIRPADCARNPFSLDDYQRLLAACGGHIEDRDPFSPTYGQRFPSYWKHACIVGWHTGLRLGDVACMEWDQIDFVGDTITVSPLKLKWRRQSLVIPMAPDLRVSMLEMDEQRTSEYVSPLMRRAYFSWTGKLQVQFSELAERAGVRGSFHCFRHSFVTRLINVGADPLLIGSITGQSINTIKRYAHVSTGAKARAMSAAIAADQPQQKESAA